MRKSQKSQRQAADQPSSHLTSDRSPPVKSKTTRGEELTLPLSLLCGLAGAILLWGAFPPLDLWPLAWVAPLPWLLLILRPQPLSRGAHVVLWLSGLIHWLAMLQGIRLAHLLLYGGWFALSAYLAIYLPLFVGLTRIALHRCRISIVIAAPVVWVGLELIRGHFVTGFSSGLLAHSQTAWPMLLQISDVTGAYGVSGLMMLVSAAAARMLWGSVSRLLHQMESDPTETPSVIAGNNAFVIRPVLPAVIALAATLGYGWFRLCEPVPGDSGPTLRVAMIQGSRDVHIDMTEEDADERMRHYVTLTGEAVRIHEHIDLILWPESMFALPEIQLADNTKLSAAEEAQAIALKDRFSATLREAAVLWNQRADNPGSPTTETSLPETWFWFCTTTLQFDAQRQHIYNTAILSDPRGAISGRYAKMHAVMFGEYIPFAKYFPFLYDWIPIGGLDEGQSASATQVKGLRLAPSICFESTVPHLIRRQVVELAGRGQEPDILVNLTNDGWFHGSTILDLHLRCSVFRAIECRKPVLICANTGISAQIDGNGRILAQGPRRKPQTLLVTARGDGRAAPYLWLGDWPAILCAAACAGLAIWEFWQRRKDHRK